MYAPVHHRPSYPGFVSHYNHPRRRESYGTTTTTTTTRSGVEEEISHDNTTSNNNNNNEEYDDEEEVSFEGRENESDDDDDSSYFSPTRPALQIIDGDDIEAMNGQTNNTNQEDDQENNESNNNDEDPNNNNNNEEDNNNSDDDDITALTNRLRCLFTCLTLPIIPLATMLSLMLLFVLYTAFLLDLHKSCAMPLHMYALASLLLFAYTPYHRSAKLYFFRYSRERDGPIRPRSVRIYDQLYHSICLIHVYTGMTLMRACQRSYNHNHHNHQLMDDNNDNDDEDDKDDVEMDASPLFDDYDTSSSSSLNICEATCPNLYHSMTIFVTTLQIFAAVLILPLVCLPCIYVYVIRRASASAAHAHLRMMSDDDDDDDEDDNDSPTTLDILNSLEYVQLIRDGYDENGDDIIKAIPLYDDLQQRMNKHHQEEKLHDNTFKATTNNNDDDDNDEEAPLLLSSSNGTSNETKQQQQQQQNNYGSMIDKESMTILTSRECCICMSNFPLATSSLQCKTKDDNDDDDKMTTTKDDIESNQKSSNNNNDSMDQIVRTKCGHIFHKRCLGGWLGGQWWEEEEINHNNDDDDNNNSHRHRHRAKRHACPLCREDLKP